MTSKPMKEIAWHLGYSDEFHFSRFLKQPSATFSKYVTKKFIKNAP